jgi:hypothetical protein
MEPLTLSAVAGVALVKGIEFLYTQAGVLLERRRERRAAAKEGRATETESEPVPIEAPDVLEGELGPVAIDDDELERRATELGVLQAALRDYAEGLDEPTPGDAELLRQVDALRLALEAIYQQRITFKGEERPPSGPILKGDVWAETVRGDAAGLRLGELVPGLRATGTGKATTVEEGGKLTGLEHKP